jgi:hypothetical protein
MMCPLPAEAGGARTTRMEVPMSRFALPAVVLFALAFAMPQSAQARQPKKYQVTGTVLEVTADFIAVDKEGDRWEIGRDSSTKITGTPKVGSKVTVEYQMSASKIDAKPDTKGK